MTVSHDIQGRISHVQLSRPGAMNSFQQDTAKALKKSLYEAMDEEGTRAVVLASEGEKAFCTGADLNLFAEAIKEGNAREIVHDLSSTINQAILGIVEGSKPVVAALDGVAAGGGLGLALACDVRIGSPRTRLTPAFLGVGVSPDAGATWFLPEMIGQARARDVMLRNRTLVSEEALKLGLLSEVTPEPGSRAVEVAGALAQGPAEAMAWSKQRLARVDALREHLAYETEATAASAETDDFREGVEAFLEGREPSFG